MNKIFVGRQEIIQDFEASIKQTKGKSFWERFLIFFRKKVVEQTQPRIFHISGDGGFGKSTLLKKCLSIAEQNGFQTILLNCESFERDLPFREELELEPIIHFLFDELSQQEPEKYNIYFKREYDRVRKRLRRVRNREKLSKSRNQVAEGVKTAAAMAMLGPPQVELAQKFGSRIHDIIALNFLPPETKEYELFQNENRTLGEIFWEGMTEVADKKPLCIGIDTFELIDLQQTLDWLKESCFHNKYNKDSIPQIVFIISGRNRHDHFIREALSDKSLFKGFYLNEKRLLLEEVGVLTQEEGLKFTDDEIRLIHQLTAGIPFVVRGTLDHFLQYPDDKDTIISEFKENTITEELVLEHFIKRVLKYCNPFDKDKIYQIALLSKPDTEILRKAWKISEDSWSEHIQSLTQRHSFLNPRTAAIHPNVRELLFSHIMQCIQVENHYEKPKILKISHSLFLALQSKLIEFENSIPYPGDRYKDNGYYALLSDTTYTGLAADPNSIILDLPNRIIELLFWMPYKVKEYVSICHRFIDSIPTGYRNYLNLLKKGVDAWLREIIPDSERLFSEAEVEFLKFLRRKIAPNGLHHILLRQLEILLDIQMNKGNIQIKEFSPRNVKRLFSKTDQLSLAYTWFQLGCYYLHHSTQINKGIDKAEAQFKKCLKINLEEPDIFQYLGNIYSKQDKSVEAIKAYEKAIEAYTKLEKMNSRLAIAWNGKANELFKLSQNKEAIEAFEKAIELDSTVASFFYGKGMVLASIGKRNEALLSFDNSLNVDSQNVYALNGKANIMFELGKYQDALKLYKQAIHWDPNFPSSWNGQGNVYVKLGLLSDALESFDKAIELNTSMAQPWNGKGNVYRLQNQSDEAINAYKKATELNPEFASPWNGMGLTYFERENYSTALKAFKHAAETDPRWAVPRIQLGDLHAKLGNYSLAISAYKKAAGLDHKCASCWYKLGGVYEQTNELNKAREAYTHALERDETNINYFYLLCNLLIKMKKPRDALYPFEKLIELVSQNSILKMSKSFFPKKLRNT